MCYPPGARPPDVPFDLLPPMVGGSGGEELTLTSADRTRFRAHLARAGQGDAGVVIAPDVRGLHSFYEDLAERFASVGIHAIAFDYFGRTAGMDRRADDFEYMPHVRSDDDSRVALVGAGEMRAELGSVGACQRHFLPARSAGHRRKEIEGNIGRSSTRRVTHGRPPRIGFRMLAQDG